MRQLLAILLFLFYIAADAQELTVKIFTELPNDITARSNPRNDLNDNPCALVIVRLAVDGAKFKGMVVGEVKRDGNEYFVYLPEGAKKLTIDAPNYLPLDVIFDDYGVTSLMSKTTYLLVIPKPEIYLVSSRKEITFNITPTDAKLYVDDLEEPVNDGKATVRLSNGQHRYKVLSKYYTTKEEEFTVSDDMSKSPICIDLDKRRGHLNITSIPTDADVFIDGKRVGTTPLNNHDVDAGVHNIKFSKSGYNSESQSVDIIDEKPVTLSKSLSTMISFNIRTTPSSAIVFFDGERLNGTSPYNVNKPEGNYKLKISAPKKFLDLNKTITVDGTQSEYTFKLKKQYFRPSGVYIAGTCQFGGLNAIGGSLGAYVYNVNIEVSYLMGLNSSEEVFWNVTEGTPEYPSSYTYKPTFIGGKVGYEFLLANFIRMTPQLGFGVTSINGQIKEQGNTNGVQRTYVATGSVGVKTDFAVLPFLALYVAPEYQLAVKKGEQYTLLSDISKNIKGWGDGFNCRVGFNLFF